MTKTKRSNKDAAKAAVKPRTKAHALRDRSERTRARPTAVIAKKKNDTRPARPTKLAGVIDLLKKPDGATIEVLMNATGWQAHSVRAALTGLRKKGRAIECSKSESGITCYRITG